MDLFQIVLIFVALIALCFTVLSVIARTTHAVRPITGCGQTARVVHVVGPQGSGKSYLLSMLRPDIIRVDTDDIMIRTYAAIRESPKFIRDMETGEFTTWLAAKENAVREIIEANPDRIVVVAGMTAHLPPNTTRMGYILSGDTCEWFKRACLREFDKLVTKRDTIERILRNNRVENIGFDIEIALGGFGVGFPPHYIPYLHNYERLKKDFYDYKLISQADAIATINSM